MIPSWRWIERISSRSATRILASSADSGSSSSRTCGLDRERPGERDPLLLAARQLVRVAAALVGQVDHLEQLADALPDLVLRALPDLQPEADVVGDGHVREQRVGLEHHADVALVRRPVGDVLAVDRDRAGRRLLEAGDHPQRRRLAAAGRAEERHELALLGRRG